MSADQEFYVRHYNGGIALADGTADPNAEEALGSGGRYRLVVEAFAKCAIGPSDRVVELGCGHGQILLWLAERYGLQRVSGIDVVFRDPQEIKGVDFRNYNLNDRWPFDDHSVDCIIAMMVFEHLFDPFHCFDEVRRTLSSKGIAYVNLTLVTGLKNRLRMLTGRLPITSVQFDRWFEERGWDGNHLHYFSVESIHRLATVCGLRIVDMRGVGAMHTLKSAWPSILASEVTFSMVAA